jgi:hypothetical protein
MSRWFDQLAAIHSMEKPAAGIIRNTPTLPAQI